jgi:predicted aconitase
MSQAISQGGIPMTDLETFDISLTKEEREVLQGKGGPILQKVMETVVRYAEALGAERLVEIEGPGHFVIPWASPGIAPPLQMLDELAEAGLQTTYPFTLDPCAPLDFEPLDLTEAQQQKILDIYRDQVPYDRRIQQLGLRDPDAYTCNPYVPEVGNTPEPGTILAWSESACAVFANSVLGARTNRNGAIMDLLSNIVGKTPLTGLLTDEGRRASWLLEIATAELPHPQLLGAAIGERVMADVPYIVGLDRFLASGLNDATRDYLQEMGAGCATYGAVGLYHVENITPEAVAQGRDLLIPDSKTHVIADRELGEFMSSFPRMWADEGIRPERCFIGCPHLSLQQLTWWSEKISTELQKRGQSRLEVSTLICTAPSVLERFKTDTDAYQRLIAAGVKLGVTCVETLFEGDVIAGTKVVTNSTKLRAYAPAVFFPDEELLEVMVSGEIPTTLTSTGRR